ncbi:MAG: thiamine pyrophosphate-dependent enzyme, partial [Alphaproteobacteria bacterium]|nr:thiamine pyrophosphate-dependent enzyme [Alphaproteobacteria bacterium]
GIVVAEVTIGSGLGFANAYRGQDNVSLTFLGDGAANQGQVYESFNMAALWKLPIVYIIENNQYAMGTSVERASAQTDFSKRGLSFGIEGQQIDGMDVEAVYTATLAALDHVRSGKGPIILEMKTYRYSGHSMSDPAKYRKREEVKEVRQQQDPINMLRDRLLERGLADEAQIKKINESVLAQIEEATQFAENSAEPEPTELMTDIYMETAHAD